MKIRSFVICLALSLVSIARAGQSYSSPALSVTIPDANLNGIQNSQTITGLGAPIASIGVTLNVSGGINGDLYAFVVHNNAMSVLLNRPGRTSANAIGYPDHGFGADASGNYQFTLIDSAANDVHWYRSFPFVANPAGQLMGAWQPDARNIDPLSTGAAFDGAARTSGLSVFNGMDPNGVWTLFISDVSSGFVSTLTGWGLNITVVPEPSAAALLLAGAALIRFRRRA